MDLVELHTVEDLAELGGVLDRIWGRTTPMVELAHLKAISTAGGYVAGARVAGRIVGGAVAFLGRAEDGTPLLHSHIAGLLPEHRGAGRGRALKLHQRSWCLARDIPLVEWTFDPLVRRNGWFNLERLGVEVRRYEVDCYGSIRDDEINGTDQSDRVLASWAVGADAVEATIRGLDPAPDEDELRRAGAVDLVDGHGSPTGHGLRAPVTLCLVPPDVVALRREDPAAAARWRCAVREAIAPRLAAGARMVGMTRSGRYVLEAAR